MSAWALLLGLALSQVSEQMEAPVEHPPTAHHKDLFPLDLSDYIGTILVALGLLVAASGGIGGGGILVPLYILVYGFKPKRAIALSNFTILGASIMNMVLNFPKRHPNPQVDRPLVDWDLVVVMQPLTIAGTLLGAFIGLILPDSIVIILLIILLGFTTYTTLKKGISQYQKETKLFEARSAKEIMRETVEENQEDEATEEKTGLLGNDDHEKSASSTDRNPLTPELAEIIEREKSSPMFKVSVLTAMFFGIIALNVLKGGKGGYGSALGITCGSSAYWALTAFMFVWIVGIFVYLRNILIEEWKIKKRLRYRYAEGDIEWNYENTLYFPAVCTLAGVFAGMFGIGGGIVMGPLMLQMGIHPLVVSATSAVMIFYTAFTGTSAYVAFGTLKWDYGWFLFVVGLLATAVGQFGVSYLVEKYQRTSYVSLSIGAVVALSTALLTLESLISSTSGEAAETDSLCG